MCSVSAVSDYYQNKFPQQNPQWGIQPFQPAMPMPQTTVVQVIDNETKEMLKKALILLDKIDKRLGDVECMDDAKAAFLGTLGLTPDDLGEGA